MNLIMVQNFTAPCSGWVEVRDVEKPICEFGSKPVKPTLYKTLLSPSLFEFIELRLNLTDFHAIDKVSHK